MVKLESIDYKSGCIPISNEDRLPYKREENNGFVSIALTNDKYPRYELLNKTAQYILSLMDGKKTVYDIFNAMVSTYGEAYREQIGKDLSILLVQLWVKNVISWKDGVEPKMSNLEKQINQKYKIKVAFDSNMQQLYDFLTSKNKSTNLSIFKNHVSTNAYNTQSNIRYSLFNMSAIYFMLLNNNNVEGLLIVDIPSASSVATLNFVMCPMTLMEEFLSGVQGMINNAAITPITKIRAHLTQNDQDGLFAKNLESVGFKYIVLLEKENNTENLFMYDCLLETGE